MLSCFAAFSLILEFLSGNDCHSVDVVSDSGGAGISKVRVKSEQLGLPRITSLSHKMAKRKEEEEHPVRTSKKSKCEACYASKAVTTKPLLASITSSYMQQCKKQLLTWMQDTFPETSEDDAFKLILLADAIMLNVESRCRVAEHKDDPCFTLASFVGEQDVDSEVLHNWYYRRRRRLWEECRVDIDDAPTIFQTSDRMEAYKHLLEMIQSEDRCIYFWECNEWGQDWVQPPWFSTLITLTADGPFNDDRFTTEFVGVVGTSRKAWLANVCLKKQE
jgi:hypothetical protein